MTARGRAMVSTSLWKCFKGMSCQTYAKKFHKSVTDTGVGWHAWIPFLRVSPMVLKGI